MSILRLLSSVLLWQLTLGWGEYLASEECTQLLASTAPPPSKGEAATPQLPRRNTIDLDQSRAMLASRRHSTGASVPGILKGPAGRPGLGRQHTLTQTKRMPADSLYVSRELPVASHLPSGAEPGLPELLKVAKGDTWLTMFIKATEKLPYAISIASAKEAGQPLVYVNEAFEALTGYTRAEACGRNCRFLQQGCKTEEGAVAELVRSIRERRSCLVKLTNYKKSGQVFVNELSLHPVYDSRGVYQYVIAIANDAGAHASACERAMLAALRQLLPSQFPASLNEREDRVVVGKAEQERQFVWAMVPSVVQSLLAERKSGISRALATRSALVTFWHFLEDSERQQLQSSGMKTDVMVKLLNHSSSHMDLHDIVTPEVAMAISELERKPFELFLQTRAGDVLAENLVTAKPASNVSSMFLAGYTFPTDAAGWLRAFVVLATATASQICLCDMTLPGSPLIYVNEAWCQCTGYSREEALGHNCRFMQGPDTEPEAIEKMVTALRDGTDVSVRIINYRKSGEAFGNLVVLRPVHDSNGVYRFCIGMQLEVAGRNAPRLAMSTHRLKVSMAELASFRNVIRSWVPRPVGRVHPRNATGQPFQENDPKPSHVVTRLREVLDGHFLLHVLPSGCKDALVAAMTKASFLPGQHVIKQGNPPNRFYILWEGVCSVRDTGHAHVATLHPGDFVGELSIINGTTRTATIVTERDSVFYVLPKAQYAQILKSLTPEHPHLVPPAAAYVQWRQWPKETEQALLNMVQCTLKEHGTQSVEMRRTSAPFADNHNNMKEALSALVLRQRLSVLYWMNNPARSLLLLMRNPTAHGAFTHFMLSHGHERAAVRLELLLQLHTADHDAFIILRSLTSNADVATLTAGEVDEQLHRLVK